MLAILCVLSSSIGNPQGSPTEARRRPRPPLRPPPENPRSERYFYKLRVLLHIPGSFVFQPAGPGMPLRQKRGTGIRRFAICRSTSGGNVRRYRSAYRLTDQMSRVAAPSWFWFAIPVDTARSIAWRKAASRGRLVSSKLSEHYRLKGPRAQARLRVRRPCRRLDSREEMRHERW